VKPAGYRVLPTIYDRWQASYGKDYSALIFPRLLRTFRTYGIPATRLLDLACGTGSLVLLLRPYGWRIWGVDASRGMVREAKAKCLPYRSHIRIAQQDMRALKLRAKVDVCTCMFDSLNHLPTLRDLHTTIRAVCRALAPGGYFIFDVNNERCYQTLWKGTQTVCHNEFTLILSSRYSPTQKKAESMVELQSKGKRGRRNRREVVTERLFTPDELRNALTRNGFKVLEAGDFNFSTVPSMGKMKTWVVARKTEGCAPRASMLTTDHYLYPSYLAV
jgi:SAM-dependent methyltransferase